MQQPILSGSLWGHGRPWQPSAPNAPGTSLSKDVESYPRTTSTRKGLGYFAFGPNATPSPEGSCQTRPSLLSYPFESRQAEEGMSASSSRAEEEHTAQARDEERAREERLRREAEEARKGEEEWVRSGGTLRDEFGRRDLVRTAAVREELRLREVERVLMKRWDAYQRKWINLVPPLNGLGSSRQQPSRTLRFADIPWPVDLGETNRPVQLADLTAPRIEEFLLGSLSVRGNQTTRRERIRNSLLRWHPDKMTPVLARVVEEEVELVRQGIREVMLCLQRLNGTMVT